MRIISKSALRDFWKKHEDSEQPLKSWFNEARKAQWASPSDARKLYPSVNIIGNNRLVFNIKGNKYRLVVKVNYDYKIIWIRFIGTHNAYDNINAELI